MKRTTLFLTFLFIASIVFSQSDFARARADKSWGFIDKSGMWVINPQFEHVKDFSYGMAAIRKNGEWGFVDETGMFAVNPQFADVHKFHDGLAAVKGGKEWVLLIKKENG